MAKRAIKIRGGNGGHPSKAENALYKLLFPLGFSPQFCIKTGYSTRGKSPYPPVYKVDAGNEVIRLAVEVDGSSHGLKRRKLEDNKKDSFLIDNGWYVLRFTNDQILTNPDRVLEKIREFIIKNELYKI